MDIRKDVDIRVSDSGRHVEVRVSGKLCTYSDAVEAFLLLAILDQLRSKP